MTAYLVDTSVWIDHLHAADARRISALAKNGIGCHSLVVDES